VIAVLIEFADSEGLGTVSSTIVLLILIGIVWAYKNYAIGRDRERIRQYVEGGGAQVVDVVWKRFGPGWFGSGNARFYEVTYKSANGASHTAVCKTSAMSGIYWTGDAPPAPRVAQK
jgi:hypothetical protein